MASTEKHPRTPGDARKMLAQRKKARGMISKDQKLRSDMLRELLMLEKKGEAK